MVRYIFFINVRSEQEKKVSFIYDVIIRHRKYFVPSHMTLLDEVWITGELDNQMDKLAPRIPSFA